MKYTGKATVRKRTGRNLSHPGGHRFVEIRRNPAEKRTPAKDAKGGETLVESEMPAHHPEKTTRKGAPARGLMAG
jgi:hypothetical protein